jgi:hypothetical protein
MDAKENLELLNISEKISIGANSGRIPFALAIATLGNLLGKYQIDIEKLEFEENEQFLAVLSLELINASEKEIISYCELLTTFQKLNDKFSEFSINTSAKPYIPNGSTLVEHRKSGFWEFAANKIELFNPTVLSDDFLFKIRPELSFNNVDNKIVLNANVLDYLMEHQELIPKEWKHYGEINFLGTVYEREGCFFVRNLYFFDGPGIKYGWGSNFAFSDDQADQWVAVADL